MSGGNYDALAEAIFFLVMVWFGGRIAQACKMSPILGEIAAGILFGPQGLDMVPYTKGPSHAVTLPSDEEGLGMLTGILNNTMDLVNGTISCDVEGSHSYLSVWQLAGNIGVALMIAESGMHLDFSKVRAVGSKAFGVAILGTFTPILLGMGCITAFGMDSYPDGLAVGSSLAPTSVGIALKLLTEGKHLHTDAGQTVVIAAFVDDIFSLIVLVIIVNLSSGSITAWGMIAPFIYSFSFLGGSAALATKVMPKVADNLLHMIPINPKKDFQIRDEVHLIIMLVSIAAFGKIGALIGSELLGTFCAGMLFCMVPHSMTVWHHSMTAFCAWLIRLFFAASVGFSVPVSDMFSSSGVNLLWKGLVIALVPCILAKVFSGFFLQWSTLKSSKWTVGWAMVGRAEFAFMVAKVANESFLCGSDDGNGMPKKMLSDDGYIITLWALLCAIVLGPVMFKRVLAQEMKLYRKDHPANIKRFSLAVRGASSTLDNDVVDNVEHILHQHHLDLQVFDRHKDDEAHEGHHDGDEEEVFQIRVGVHRSEDMDEEELEMIKHEVEDAVNDHGAKVIVTSPRQKRDSGELKSAVAYSDVEGKLGDEGRKRSSSLENYKHATAGSFRSGAAAAAGETEAKKDPNGSGRIINNNNNKSRYPMPRVPAEHPYRAPIGVPTRQGGSSNHR